MSLQPAFDLRVAGTWVDITSRVLGYRFDLVEGQDDEAADVSFSQVSLVLDNDDRRFSNRNPTSLWFGLIGKNTPLRLRLGTVVHFVGEVPEWPPEVARGAAALDGDPATHIRVPIRAAGIMRRLGQGARALHSPLRRTITTTIPPAVAYWHLEDGAEATQAGSGLPGGLPMTTAGGGTRPSYARHTDLPGATAAPEFGGGGWLRGSVPHGSTLAWTVEFDLKSVRAPVGTSAVNFPVLQWTGGGSAWAWSVYLPLADGTAPMEVHVASPLGGTDNALQKAFTAVEFDEVWHHYAITASISGGTTTVGLYVDGSLWDIAVLTVVGDFGAVSTVVINPVWDIANQTHINDLDVLAVSHLAVFNGATPSNASLASGGYVGEAAVYRFWRLCTEEGIPPTVVGKYLPAQAPNPVDPDSTAMGAQGADTLLNLLRDCADAEQGILCETRGELGLTLRARLGLYNQYGPNLTYGLLSDLAYTDDDQRAWNLVTVTRPGGASSTVEVVTGPMSTQVPPTGVGTYDRGALTVNVADDDVLPSIAGWIAHLGTWDEIRYPLVEINLNDPRWATNPTATARILDLGVGDAFQLDDLPSWLAPDLTQLQIRGRRLVAGGDADDAILQWTTVPGWAWEVWRLETGGSTLARAVDEDDTVLRPDTSVGPEWSATQVPYFWQIAGEAMKVLTVSTSTPGTPVAGAVTFATNAPVTPPLPAGLAEGDALFVLAAIGNVAANPNTPTGYTQIRDWSNVRLFARYASAAESAPTVTYSGGGASDITGAVCFKSTNCSIWPDASMLSANGSAQNIAYPFLRIRRDKTLMLWIGQKQNGWTSVATLGGITELFDAASASGNQLGLVADYAVEGAAPINVAAGTFVVTGGSAAVSKGITVALRPLQSVTVTRSVNGVAKTQAVGAAVKTWRLGVVGL